ncbi:TPA: GntR family transcriptional regulator [Staphylococcus argenteus]|nr:GntR family transcriptional regulator [Staphylococcus argenteus]
MLKYEHIAEQLNSFIHQSNFKPGDKLPNVTQLKERYQVSKSTIIKALGFLEQDGIIYQAQGSGIYVRNIADANRINVFKTNGFSKSLGEQRMTSKVLAFEEILTPPKSVKDELQLNEGDTVYYLKRLRYVDDAILCIEYSYFHKNIVKYLTPEIAKGSIFDYLESNMKIRVGFSDIFFNVDQLHMQEAELLKLSVGEPCLRYHQTFYTMTGKPFDSSDIVFHYRNAQFYIPSKK